MPNVVFILSDDQGYGDLSRTGNSMISTPNLDKLAQNGAIMEHFYVQALCAPTRAEILTGRCYHLTGVCGVANGAERLNLDETTIAEIFKKNNYNTGLFGKWHSGMQYPYHPNARGFDEFIGYCCGHWGHYFNSIIEHNGAEYKSQGYLPDVLTSHAIDFIEENQNQPFFCFLSLNTPHWPGQVPDEFFDKFANLQITQQATENTKENKDKTKTALAMCENIDYNIGRLVKKLEQLELYDDTIIVYLSDNGPNSHRWNCEMKGVKGDINEGGVRSPCSITYRNKILKQKVLQVASACDFLPTLCALCNIKLDTEKPLTGIDLSPWLCYKHKKLDMERKVYAISCDRINLSVRQGDFRIYKTGEVYNLSHDIGETHNLSLEHFDKVKEIHKAMDNLLETLPPMQTFATIPLGYKEWPVSYLQTQDAQLSGSLCRSSIHPNCSWIKNWRDMDSDYLTWNIDIINSGEYNVAILYTAPMALLGSIFEVRCKNFSCKILIDKEFDSQELSCFDRFQRDESYEKEFHLSSTSKIYLPQGECKFYLKALYTPTNIMPDVRALQVKNLSF